MHTWPRLTLTASLAVAAWGLSSGEGLAQFLYHTNQGVIVITGYTGSGSGGVVAIPDTIDGLPVGSLGDGAMAGRLDLTRVVVGRRVGVIGSSAFAGCTNQGAIVITGYTGSGSGGAVAIPDTIDGLPVASLGDGVLAGRTDLTRVTVGRGVQTIGSGAFAGCTNLIGIYFEGRAPEAGHDAFAESPATVYHLPGTAGWGPTFAGRPTAPWVLPQPVILDGAPVLGASPAGYGLRVSWATNIPVVIEASANLANPEWSPVATNHLFKGWTDFVDPQPANQPQRWYRVGPRRPPASLVMWGDSMVAAGGLNTAIAGLLAPRTFIGISYSGAQSYQILARLREEVQGPNSFRGWLHAFFHATNNLNDSEQVRSAALAMAELAGTPDHRVIWLSVIGELRMTWNGSRLVAIQHESAFQGWGGIWELEQWYEAKFPGSLLNCRQALIDGAPSTPSLHYPGLTEAQAAATYGVLPLSFYMNMSTKPWTPAALTFRGYWSHAGLPGEGTDGDYWLRTGNGMVGAVLVRWDGTWTEHIFDLAHLTPAGNAVLARAFVRFLADESL